jgi:hypothetical protein
VSERRDDGHKHGFCRPSAAMHSAVSRNRLKSFALNLLVSWAGWTPANHRRNPVIIKATAIARFSARHSDARNLVVATSIARYHLPPSLLTARLSPLPFGIKLLQPRGGEGAR